jgi:hypothetical protein
MNKQTYLNNLHHNLGYFGSNYDIMDCLNCGPEQIIKYSQLKDYTSLQELLPLPFDYKIILLETNRNTGHWVAILRLGGVIECFNSYGIGIDNEWAFIPDSIERLLGQSTRYLTKLIKKSEGFTVISNKYKFQSKSDDVATCARWCILRIETAKMGYGLKEFVKMIEQQEAETDMPADILVLDYVRFKSDRKIQ